MRKHACLKKYFCAADHADFYETQLIHKYVNKNQEKISVERRLQEIACPLDATGFVARQHKEVKQYETDSLKLINLDVAIKKYAKKLILLVILKNCSIFAEIHEKRL